MSENTYRKQERGGAGIKFLIVLTIIFLIGNAGYNYIPVAYQAENFKSELETAVVKGAVMPTRATPLDAVKMRVRGAMTINQIPDDATVDIKMVKNVIQARVAYSKEVELMPFGIYKYSYQFDHTATPAGFLLKEN
ncbi:MAG TPA: hypothetical protein VK892_03835 [Pyrinomonadaceae bacterium]|nr:hypothetical protein [Pyrinomonadaceae bacterium]